VRNKALRTGVCKEDDSYSLIFLRDSEFQIFLLIVLRYTIKGNPMGAK